MTFSDRADAGRRLAAHLDHLRAESTVVLGLSRGGVPVAAEVAEALGARLDVVVVRKLGVPYQPELGMGAIGEDGVRIINQAVITATRVTDDDLAEVERRERAELERRTRRFRSGLTRIDLAGRTAVVVDDGIATGSTARAACRVARAHGAARVVLAVPVAPLGWAEELGDEADEYIAVTTPATFRAIGQFYQDFTQTSDDQVVACLDRLNRPPADTELEVHSGSVRLGGRLTVPVGARGLVVFAHGSGSSRHSPRNLYVADVLHQGGLGTLLFDLLTPDEEGHRVKVFDIDLLARRLTDGTQWLRGRPEAEGLPIGCFGASTGAAAALWASTEPGSAIAAVVSRGGRPDLARERLPAVTAPTLLVVGGRDEAVLELNRQAQGELRCPNELAVVPGATHLFEEPGTLQQVAVLARGWFGRNLNPSATSRS